MPMSKYTDKTPKYLQGSGRFEIYMGALRPSTYPSLHSPEEVAQMIASVPHSVKPRKFTDLLRLLYKTLNKIDEKIPGSKSQIKDLVVSTLENYLVQPEINRPENKELKDSYRLWLLSIKNLH